MPIKKSNEGSVVVTLSQDQKAAINKGLQSIDEGRARSNQEVKVATRKKYAYLFT